MTKRRVQVLLDRYHGYADAWSALADEDGRITGTTHRELAALSGHHPQSVRYSLGAMLDLSIIGDLVVHKAHGTSFVIIDVRRCAHAEG